MKSKKQKFKELILSSQDFQVSLSAGAIEELEALLYEEEKKENYERCALIRDEIIKRAESVKE
mgnify:CR=1 FL=1